MYVGIYWNNHHHMLHASGGVNGADAVGKPASVVLAVAVSVCHRLDGRESFRAGAVRALRVVLLMAAIAYWVLQQTIIASEGPDSVLKKAVGRDWKGKLSPLLYIVAIFATPGRRG